ncbi:major intrinsically disordered Notch2-binding receptor 1 [Eptesicus fuscus]|uniref:major intrinsically disordered Notch2-binding receptor 1 n=1 Tax=Eptesicus fuscus TaxID=29078 RepID=UPI002404150A|nr:major intrinsically disordered Notch2-binding receptor 1 [Eptesicus fuscus]
MEAGQDASLFLAKMLEELDSKRRHVSYQDLCRSLCARFDLPQLARLRGVLFCTACLDPGFPATLFKDKMKCPGSSQQSKKIMVAADIVTIFNLIQMTGGAARDKLPAACPTAAACDSCRPDDDDDTEPLGCGLAQGPFGQAFPARQPAPCREADCTDCPQFVPASEPSFLLGVGKEAKARAASLERLQARAPYAAAGPQPCEMQRTYFPMTLDSESVSDQDSLPGPPGGVQGTFVANDDEEEPFGVRSCLQKRTIFKGDFQNLLAVSPGLAGPADEAEAGHGDPQSRKEPPKALFLNHSFDVPYGARYLNAAAAAAYSPVPDKRRAKHESLDDLQASTYFGPTPAMGTPDARRGPGGRPGKQTPWPAKSWSLNAEEVPDAERCLFHRNPSYEKLQRYPSPGVPAPDQRPAYLAPPTTTTTEQQPLLPAGYAATTNGLHAPATASPVAGLEEREPGTKVKDKSISSTGGQLSSDTSSVGTQTEQPGPEPKPRQDLQGPYGDRHANVATAARPSDDDSEIVSDDISDIFRFLDDMSLSGSTGVIHSSCCDSTGSLSQLPRSDGDSSLERAAAKLAGELPGSQGEKGKRGPDRGGPRSEEELKTSVCKLVLRIGEIERKLESLSGVRDEISQVLGKLSQLDRKMQPPERARGQADLSSLTSGAPSEESASPRGLPARRGSRGGPKADGGGGGADWCCSDGGGSHSESLRVKALKRSLFARPSSRSLTEEDSATESKVASIANSPRDWRTITYAGRLSLDGEEEEVRGRGPGESKGWRRKSKEADRQYDVPPQHRRPRPPRDFLVEQVFSPHPYPASLKAPLKSNPLYTDLRLTELAEVRRGPPSWAAEEFARSVGDKGKLAALDLQTQESLNPNHLEYWMEDIYTPGYDSLLKRKEAEFRRARVCKLAALVAAAACTVILVIVVPLCTMKS